MHGVCGGYGCSVEVGLVRDLRRRDGGGGRLGDLQHLLCGDVRGLRSCCLLIVRCGSVAAERRGYELRCVRCRDGRYDRVIELLYLRGRHGGRPGKQRVRKVCGGILRGLG